MPALTRPRKANIPSSTWLVATHAVLCLSALLIHLSRYPLAHSLYYWWLAPFDAVALIVLTPLYLIPSAAPWALCFALITTAAEWLALSFLGISIMQRPLTIDSAGVMAIMDALLVATRIPLGWFIANMVRPQTDIVRGCL